MSGKLTRRYNDWMIEMLTRIDPSSFEDDANSETSIQEAIELDVEESLARLTSLLRSETDASERGVSDVSDVPDVTDSVSSPQHTNPAEALSEFIKRFVDLPGPDEQVAFTVWVIHSHAIDHQDCTPRLALLSPEPGSGKTRALEVLELLVPNAYPVFDSSPAALFRLFDRGAESGLPTVLFDEVDNALSDRTNGSNSLIAILNSGYTRGKFVQRVKEQQGSYVHEKFEAFAPVALAGLHSLPPALADRSIVINMRPSLNGKAVERLRPKRLKEATDTLTRLITQWVELHKDQLGEDVDDLPVELSDRSAQIWEPLIMIGDLLGGEWSSRVRLASINLSARNTRMESSEGVRLLADIKRIFGQEQKVSTAELLSRLWEIEDSPWARDALNLTARSLSDKLSRYGIRPVSVRIGDETLKGYRRSDFVDAWSRYLRDAVTSVTSGTSGTSPSVEIICPNCKTTIVGQGA